jgi:hypothetical protein
MPLSPRALFGVRHRGGDCESAIHIEAGAELRGPVVITRPAYKLVRLRKDGTLGPLFINARQRLRLGEWLEAEHGHHKSGFAYRPGWHSTRLPEAPHLSPEGRVWVQVEIRDWVEHRRPEAQGGLWFLSRWIKFERVLTASQPVLP